MPQETMADDLRELLRLCQHCLAVVERENQALSAGEGMVPGLTEARKRMLPDLDHSLGKLRIYRAEWSRLDPAQRSKQVEVAALMRQNMELIWRVIALDRENERLLLRMGKVPVREIPAAASQQPHFVSNLYRRNNTGS